MNLSQYVKKRNGVPMGHSKSLRNNLLRSLGAKNFAVLWNFWNPIFGYYLGTKIFKPLKEHIPEGFALVLTFVFCGMLHDAVTTVIRGKMSLFFSVWFLLMGMAVLISKYTSYEVSNTKWLFRAFINVAIIGLCLCLTLLLNTLLEFY